VPVVVIGVSPDVVGVVTGTLGVSGVVETDTGVGDVVLLEARHDSICFRDLTGIHIRKSQVFQHLRKTQDSS